MFGNKSQDRSGPVWRTASSTANTAPEMSLLLQLVLTLTCMAVLGLAACQVHVGQQGWRSAWSGSRQITLRCDVTVTQCAQVHEPKLFWFVITSNSRKSLQTSEKHHHDRYNLHIRDVTVNDSGVYYCGAVLTDITSSGVQDVGGGTLLVVKEDSRGKQALVWTLFIILLLYNLALLVLFAQKKMGWNVAVFGQRRHGDSSKGDSLQNAHFHSVIGELTSKRNFQKHVKKHNPQPSLHPKGQLAATAPMDENVYQNM